MDVLALLRAIGLMLGLVVTGTIATLLQLILYPFLLIFDKNWVVGHRITIGSTWLMANLFLDLEVHGLENLPRPFTKTIIISNHQSTLDIFILARLCFLNFYVVFKREILFYPGVGTAMWLARYLSVNRKDKESGRTLMRQATAVLNRGLSLCWFPEGTRKIDGSSGPLGPFKPGAFIVARDAGATILPVTISGARRLMPAGGAPQLRTGRVVLTIHPPISCAGKDVDTLMDATRAAIVSGLRDIDTLPAPKAGAATSSPAASSPAVAASAAVAAPVESKKTA